MVKVSMLLIERYFKANIRRILRVQDVSVISMVFILENFKMEGDLAMACLGGIMDKYFKAYGKMELKMDMEYGDHLKEIIIKDNGEIIDSMEMDFLNTKIVHIKDNLKIF